MPEHGFPVSPNTYWLSEQFEIFWVDYDTVAFRWWFGVNNEPFLWTWTEKCGRGHNEAIVQLEMVTRSHPSQRMGHAYLHNSGQENSHDAKPQRKTSDYTQCVSLLLQYPALLSSLFTWPEMRFLPSQATKFMHLPPGQIQPFFFSKIKILIQTVARSPIHKRTQTPGVCSSCNVTRSTWRNIVFQASSFLVLWRC